MYFFLRVFDSLYFFFVAEEDDNEKSKKLQETLVESN